MFHYFHVDNTVKPHAIYCALSLANFVKAAFHVIKNKVSSIFYMFHDDTDMEKDEFVE